MKSMRWLAFLVIVLLCAPAWAQGIGGNGANGIAGNNTVSSGTTCITGCNAPAGLPGYQIGGQTALRFSTNTKETAIFAGTYSGASNTIPNIEFINGWGTYTWESLNGPTTPESFAAGNGAAIAVTTGTGINCEGVSACASETTSGNIMAYGGDAMRDVWDAGGDAVFGVQSYVDGGLNAGNESVFGNASLTGNNGTITVGSTTPHVGDTYPFTITSANGCGTANCVTGAPVSYTYTVTSADSSAAQFAINLATALNAATANITYVLGDGNTEEVTNTFGINFQNYDTVYHPLVIRAHIPGNWQITVTPGSCTGTCTETVTWGAPFSGTNNALHGNGIFEYFGTTTASNNTLSGNDCAQSYATSASNNDGSGYKCFASLTIGSWNTGHGIEAFFNLQNNNYNTGDGAFVGYQVTGGNNSIFGAEDGSGQGCITSGGGNLELAFDACVPSPTANYQMSIQNAIYGAGNSGTGSTLSTGCLGFFNAACSGTGTAAFGAAGGTAGSIELFGSTSGNITISGGTTTPSVVFSALPSGTPATYACFTSGGALVSSVSAC